MSYVINLIIRDENKRNEYKRIESDTLDFCYEKQYNVKSEALFRRKPLLQRFRKKEFTIVFNKGKPEPVSWIESNISGRTIKKVQESKAVMAGIKKEFAERMNPRTLLIIFVGALILVISYFALTGELNIGF